MYYVSLGNDLSLHAYPTDLLRLIDIQGNVILQKILYILNN